MKKNNGVLSALLILSLLLTALAGCSGGQNEDAGPEQTDGQESGEQAAFSYSDGIDDSGYWKGIKALEHVELFDYQAIPIPSSEHTISDERVQGEVNTLLANHSVDNEILDRAVENGDTVNIDYVGSVDGVEFEGGTTGGAGTLVTIGVTSYIDDFLEQLIGHMPGETINVEVTFPEDYGNAELGGKDAVFVTDINYIVETVVPELTDAFVSENLAAGNGWRTVAEMNEGIYSDLREEAILSYVRDYLMEHATVSSLPDELLAYMEGSMRQYYQEGAEFYGMEIEEFLSMYEGVSTIDELLERYRDNHIEQGNYYLAVQAVAEAADITAGEDDVKAYFSEYVGTDDYSQYEDEYGMPYLKQVVLNQMVLDYLAEHAVLE